MSTSTAAALIATALVSCGAYDNSVAVTDVTKEEVIVLTNPSSGPVHALAIRVTGHIDGEATLSVAYEGKLYDTATVKGAGTTRVRGGDWYSDSAVVLYRPTNVTAGELIIEYEFSNL